VLQVGLSVQTLGFNITHALWQTAPNNHHITWEELVLVNFDDLADSHVAPQLLLKMNCLLFSILAASLQTFLHRHSNLCLSVVLFVVLSMAVIILVEILDHGNTNHKGERASKHRHSSGIRDGWDALHNRQDEEVKVCELGELEHQIEGQKGEKVVFACYNLIPLVKLLCPVATKYFIEFDIWLVDMQ
jgi:hypothetical protein